MRIRAILILAVLALGLVLASLPASAEDCTNAGPVTVGQCPQSPPPSPASSPAAKPGPSETAATSESRFFSLINSERTARGLRPLKRNAVLQDIARDHAARMARDGRIYHNYTGLSSTSTHRRLGYPEMIGENVGVGPSTQWLHDEFMGSSKHKANILEPRYTSMGIGVVISDGSIWVVEDFVRDRQPVSTKPQAKRGGSIGRSGGGGSVSADVASAADVAAAVGPAVVTTGAHSSVSSLRLPPLPAPGLAAATQKSSRTPPAMPVAMLAMLSATALVTRRGGTGWI